MSGRILYRKFLSVCEKWPKDEAIVGRDYAEYFRSRLAKHFPNGDLGDVVDSKSLEAEINSLERIVRNSYFKENPLKRCAASGLDADECKIALSNDSLKLMQEQDEATLLTRLKQSLSMRFSSEDNINKGSE